MPSSGQGVHSGGIVTRLILAGVVTVASIVLAVLSVGWAVECFAPQYPHETMLTVISGSAFPLTLGIPCAFVVRKERVVGLIFLFIAVLLCFAMGAGYVIENAQGAVPDSGAYGLILGGAFALLTVVDVVVGCIIAPIGKLLDERRS